jgi:hypothetical protein
MSRKLAWSSADAALFEDPLLRRLCLTLAEAAVAGDPWFWPEAWTWWLETGSPLGLEALQSRASVRDA